MRFCLKLSKGLCYISANSKGSGQTALMRRLARAFAGGLCDKCSFLMCCLKKSAPFWSIMIATFSSFGLLTAMRLYKSNTRNWPFNTCGLWRPRCDCATIMIATVNGYGLLIAERLKAICGNGPLTHMRTVKILVRLREKYDWYFE